MGRLPVVTMQLILDAFDKGLGDVRAASDRLGTDRLAIDQRVRGFLGSGWTGVAADSFVDAWDAWLAAAVDVEEGLVAMSELLVATRADFITQDEASQQALDAVSARIIERLG